MEQIREQTTDFRTELVAGATTFLSMAYIMFVNPQILGQTGMDQQALTIVTCLATAIASILVGTLAKSPIAMAPGMGLNAFFTYSLVAGDKMPWQTALGIVFLSGLVFLLLTVFGLRRRLVDAIPGPLVYAISVGIGVFITFIGLQNLGLVVKHPQTMLTLGKFTPTVLMGLFGLLLMLVLEARRVRGALLIGILATTLVAVITGHSKVDQVFTKSLDIAPIAFQLDIGAALKWSLAGAIFSLMFVDMFDSVGTLVACCHKAEQEDEEGNIRGLDRLLALDAVATMLGALLGTSTTTAYIESGAGIEAGGRRGITSIVVGVLFLVSLLFVPLIGVVPAYATAPALIMVGLFMVREITRIDFSDIDQAFPAFIILVMIAFTYSISAGLAFGFISYTLIKLIRWKLQDIKPAMWVITGLSIVFLVL